METLGLVATLTAALIAVVGIVWTIISVHSNSRLRGLIIAEKRQLAERLMDLRHSVHSYIDQVMRDREKDKNVKYDQIYVSVTTFEAWVKNLERIAEELKSIS